MKFLNSFHKSNYKFYHFRAPYYSRPDLKTEQNFFNMTFTYRLKSDIFWNYGLFADLETGSIVGPSKNVRWKMPEIVDGKYILSKDISQGNTLRYTLPLGYPSGMV